MSLPEIFISPDRSFAVLSMELGYRPDDREISGKFSILAIVRTDSGDPPRLLSKEYRRTSPSQWSEKEQTLRPYSIPDTSL